jgi:hypothetical protein
MVVYYGYTYYGSVETDEPVEILPSLKDGSIRIYIKIEPSLAPLWHNYTKHYLTMRTNPLPYEYIHTGTLDSYRQLNANCPPSLKPYCSRIMNLIKYK